MRLRGWLPQSDRNEENEHCRWFLSLANRRPRGGGGEKLGWNLIIFQHIVSLINMLMFKMLISCAFPQFCLRICQRAGNSKRNPSQVSREAGSEYLLLPAVRMFLALLSHEPPRSTFSLPLDGPAGLFLELLP